MLADTASWKLHSHPLVADNRMADTRVVECTLALSALNVGEAMPMYTAFGVAYVFVLFLALGTVSTVILKRTRSVTYDNSPYGLLLGIHLAVVGWSRQRFLAAQSTGYAVHAGADGENHGERCEGGAVVRVFVGVGVGRRNARRRGRWMRVTGRACRSCCCSSSDVK